MHERLSVDNVYCGFEVFHTVTLLSLDPWIVMDIHTFVLNQFPHFYSLS